MLRFNLLTRMLLVIVLVVVGYSIALYAISVPMIGNAVVGAEERAARTILDNVYDIIISHADAIEAHRRYALDAYKRELKNITRIQESFIKGGFERYKAGLISEEQAKAEALDDIRRFRFGEKDYMWVMDLNGVMLSHPNLDYIGKNFSRVRDIKGDPVAPDLKSMVKTQVEGYRTYYWSRLEGGPPRKKLAYGRLFSQWNWIIGTGVYIDDMEAQVEKRKAEVVDDIRRVLSGIRIARTGYVFVFDSSLNMILHPDPNIDRTNFAQLENPVTGVSIGEELIEAAQTKSREFKYKWDKPGDPGRYIHDKIAWIRYVKELDWYIVSSVYADELGVISGRVSKSIFLTAAGFLVICLLIMGFFVSWLLKPIGKLSAAAVKVRKGDLAVKVEEHGAGEIRLLIRTFNNMVAELKSLVENLDSKVRERTRELDEKNEKLRMEIFERERTEEEIKRTQASYRTIFENAVEGIYQFNPQGALIKANTAMAELLGYGTAEELLHSSRNILIQNFAEQPHWKAFLQKIQKDGFVSNYEIRLFRRSGDRSWVSFSARAVCDAKDRLIYIEGLAYDITERKASELELQRKATIDELTGLPNRYLFRLTFEKMLAQAARDYVRLGVLYVDLDYFKNVNDQYGHKTGDLVLMEVGRRIKERMRKSDSAARVGGDEFIVLLWNVAEDWDVRHIAEEIIDTLSQPYIINEDLTCHISASVGAAVYPVNGTDPDLLIKKADEAMYQVKGKGKRGFVLAAA